MLNRFNSNARKLNRVLPKINTNNLNDDLYLTGSLLNIDIPSTQSYQSNVRVQTTTTKITNNKNTINEFHNEILQYSGRLIKKSVDSYSNDGFGKLILNNTVLDYGTEGASPDNFEIIVGGLHIPGNYTIKEVGTDVVITLNDSYIDFDSQHINDIYVIGKFK